MQTEATVCIPPPVSMPLTALTGHSPPPRDAAVGPSNRTFVHGAASCCMKRRSADKLAIHCRRIRYDAVAASGFISGNLSFDNRYAG